METGAGEPAIDRLSAASDGQVALLVILPAVLSAFIFCLLLALLLWARHRRRARNTKERQPLKQHLTAVRPDHPIAFVLPTVAVSETGSEPISDVSGLSHSSSSSSLATLHSFSSPLTSLDSTSGSETPSRFSRGSTLGFCARYDVTRQQLTVRVIGAKHLPSKIRTATADAYVKVCVMPDRRERYTTRVIRNSQDPVFNEEFVFVMRPAQLDVKVLRLTVCDFDKFARRAVLGSVQLPLSRITGSQRSSPAEQLSTGELWLQLEDRTSDQLVERTRGQLEVSLCYATAAQTLYIEVIRAKELRLRDGDAVMLYVKLSWFERRRVTRTRKSRPCRQSSDPEFNERMTVPVNCGQLSNVCLVLAVCVRNKLGARQTVGRSCLGPITYSTGSGLQHWNLMLHSFDRPVVMWHDLT